MEHRTPRGLKQRKLILSQFWRPEVQNPCHWAEVKVSAGLRFLQSFWEESAPRLSQLPALLDLRPCRPDLNASIFRSLPSHPCVWSDLPLPL